MTCQFCGKKLRADNRIETCRSHRALSSSRKMYMQNYAANNKEKIRAIKKRHSPKAYANFLLKRKADPVFKLKTLLRARLLRALKGNYKSGSAVSNLGCSVEEFKVYMESKFLTGMSWENHGKWHIDHIIPLSFFNLSNIDELKKACHYSNLQPLWASDNIKKSNRI